MGTLFIDTASLERFAWTVVHSLWLGTVVFLLLRLSLLILATASARTRYSLCVLALFAVVAAPIVTFKSLEGRFDDPGPLILIADGVGISDSDARALQMTAFGRLSELIRAASPGVCVLWLAVVIALSLHHVTVWLWIQRSLITRSKPLAGWQNLTDLAERLSLPSVRFLESTLTDVPATLGWLKPVVLLPPAALTGLSVEQIEAIVAHELAHITRRDYLVNLLQTVAETVMFYHPVVWWISARIRDERELCCDDIASAVSQGPERYGSALVALAELRHARRSPGLLLAATGGPLLRRVVRLLPIAGEADAVRFSTRPVLGLALSAVIVLTLASNLRSAMTARPARSVRDVASLSARVYEILGTSPSAEAMLPTLEESVAALRAGAVTEAVAMRLATALDSAAPDELSAEEVPQLLLGDPLAHQRDPNWNYGTFYERLALTRLLWKRAEMRCRSAPAEAQFMARGALLLAAQDCPLFGASGLRFIISRPAFAEVAGLTPRQASRLRRHVDDHLTITRAFISQLANVENMLAAEPSEDQAAMVGTALCDMAGLAHQRLDIQWRIATLKYRLVAEASSTIEESSVDAVVSELLARVPSPTFARWLEAGPRSAAAPAHAPLPITHAEARKFRHLRPSYNSRPAETTQGPSH